jgi:hypothetical protein
MPLRRDELLHQRALAQEPLAVPETAKAAPERVAAPADTDVLSPASEAGLDHYGKAEPRIDVASNVGRARVREPATAEAKGSHELVVRSQERPGAVEHGDTQVLECTQVLETRLWPVQRRENVEPAEGEIAGLKEASRVPRTKLGRFSAERARCLEKEAIGRRDGGCDDREALHSHPLVVVGLPWSRYGGERRSGRFLARSRELPVGHRLLVDPADLDRSA